MFSAPRTRAAADAISDSTSRDEATPATPSSRIRDCASLDAVLTLIAEPPRAQGSLPACAPLQSRRIAQSPARSREHLGLSPCQAPEPGHARATPGLPS